MKFKTVFRFDPTAKLFRLFRVVRSVGKVGDGVGYSTKTSLSLAPRLFSFRRECEGWMATLFGVRLHHQRSYGGIFV